MTREDFTIVNNFEEECLLKDNKYDLITLFIDFVNEHHPTVKALNGMRSVLREQKKRVAQRNVYEFSFENNCTEQGKNQIVKELTDFLNTRGYSFGTIKTKKT